MLKKLAQCVREYKGSSLATLFLMVGEALIETIIPFITATYLINHLQNAATTGSKVDVAYIIKIGLVLIGMALLSLTCGGLGGFTCAKASAGFAKNLRHDIFAAVQQFSFANVDRFTTSSLVTRLTTDVQNVQMSYMMLIRIAVRCPLMLIFSVAMSAYMGGWLAATFVVVIPVLGGGLMLVAKKAMPAFRRVFKKYDKLNEAIEENIMAARVVKGFSRENYEKEKFGREADSICEDFTKAERIVALNSPLMNFCMYFNMVFILLVGSMLAIKYPESGVQIGQISALITYGVQVLMSLMMLSMIYVMLTISAESAHRIYEVLVETPTMNNPEKPIYTIADGSVDFNHVHFKYSEKAQKEALSDIDLHVASGMTVGILGGTGVGKSSMVQLIARLYDATKGSVMVGGHDVRDYDLTALRDSVSMVLQKNLLFAGTIKENLRWGNENATDEEIVAACQLAQADEFISTFPDQYDTYIEQGGTNVSGGQKQRLCIARALLKKPKIIIFDDSTSAVDTKTDALIRSGMKTYIPETTKIIIAQRVASVMDADMIIILDNGKIVARGTHTELLASCDIYREIYEQQTVGGDDHE